MVICPFLIAKVDNTPAADIARQNQYNIMAIRIADSPYISDVDKCLLLRDVNTCFGEGDEKVLHIMPQCFLKQKETKLLKSFDVWFPNYEKHH